MFKIIPFIIFLFTWGCNNINEPDSINNKLDTEIQYKKRGGWINTSILNISVRGSVNAYLQSHSTLDTLKSGFAELNFEERDEILRHFNSFGKYESYYQPFQWYTDGNYHTIVFIRNGLPDTVTVYEPQNCVLPEGLTEIINELENLWMKTIEKNDVTKK